MTLRELIIQVTDNNIDLSESFVELDYSIVASVKEEGHYTIFDKLTTRLFNSNEENKTIELVVDYKNDL